MTGMLHGASYLQALTWRLAADNRGFSAILTALAAVFLMGFAGLAVDVGYWQMNQRNMQGSADQAAFAAAVEYSQPANNCTTSCPAAVAAGKGVAAQMGFTNSADQVTVTVTGPTTIGGIAGNWSAQISQPQPMWFSKMIPGMSAPTASASAVAGPNPTTGPACAMALDPTGQDTFLSSGSGVANFSTCDIIDDSSDAKALECTGSATVDAMNMYIVGGDNPNCSGGINVTGTLKTGSPVIPDPYASRTYPNVSGYSCGTSPTTSGSSAGYNGNYNSPSTPTTIYPGVYCGNLTAQGPLTLSPGVYILKGGALKVGGGTSTDPVLNNGTPNLCTSPDNKAYINGTGVTIYSTTGSFAVSSCISLSAPSAGSTDSKGGVWENQGIAVWVDKNAASNGQDTFSGGSNVAILGAIYAPSQEVDYTGSATATTGCTQIVSGIIQFTGAVNFQHNCTGTGVSDPTIGSAIKLVQ